MKIDLKTAEEIEIMKEGGIRLRRVVNALLKQVIVGETTERIDRIAEKLIIKEGGEPSFKKVKGYFWTTCLPINEQVVHTPPSKRRLADGDLLTVDIGMFYKGYHTDFATSFIVGALSNDKITDFLKTGKQTLINAIASAKAGNRLGHISDTIEKGISGSGYFILKELTGHGIGKTLHEDPYVFGFNEKPINKTMLIKPGLTIAIEVIYSLGTEEIVHEKNNNWSIITADMTMSACFEHTIAITENKTLIIT